MSRNHSEPTSLERLFRLAAKQHGVFTSDQAIGVGLTHSQIGSLVDRGLAHRRRRGLFVVAGSPDTAERRTMEAILAGPPGCVASHESAAYLLGLVDAPSQVHVTVHPRRRLRSDGVVAHRSVLPSSHVARVGCIPVTSLPRTVVDLASVSDLDRLASVMDPLLVSKRLQPARLLRVVDEIVEAPGRHGTALLRAALDVWTQPIKPGSPAEVRLLRRLGELGFDGFVTQHEIDVDGDRFRLDVAWPDERALLEYSGKAFHGPRRWERDERRAEMITRLGWSYREVDASDLVPGSTGLWAWLDSERRNRRRAA